VNNQTVVERELPSGRKVRITIDDEGFVLVEGAVKANIIYDFYFSELGYGFAPPARGEQREDYICVHTEQGHDGVTAELSAKIGGQYRWWHPLERAAMRLWPVHMMGHTPFFQLQFRGGGHGEHFEMADERMLQLDEKAA
jgi:hypothetical protein